jgi:hypothetical protein
MKTTMSPRPDSTLARASVENDWKALAESEFAGEDLYAGIAKSFDPLGLDPRGLVETSNE